MKIAIDARMVLSRRTGIGQYIYSLIQKLVILDQNNEYLLLVNEPNILAPLIGQAKHFQLEKINSYPLSLAEHLEIPQLLKHKTVNLYHSPAYILPWSIPCNYVYSLLDVIPLRFPSGFSFLTQIYFKTIVKKGLSQAKEIIAISKTTKKDLSFFYHIPDDKITVIYLAPLLLGNLVAKNASEILTKYQIRRPYLLYHGSKKPHKNVLRLIDAFARLIQKNPKELYLVITGIENTQSRETDFLSIKHKVRELNLPNRIIYPGYIREEDLPVIYQQAALFVFPTLYEGFGLPPLEAMECGCPVVVSNVSSLPEICGTAAYYIDPYNVESIDLGMERVLKDDNLRQTLIQKGYQQAKRYTWDKCARETLAVYQKAVGE